MHYLIRVVSKYGIFPDPAELEKIWQWPKPDKNKRLASFLNLCNYYKNLIPSFAHLSDALYKASRLDFIEWTQSLEKQVEDLKQQLVNPRIVRLPDPQRDFILETTSGCAILGCVLKQKFEDTSLKQSVGSFSRALTKSELNYAVYNLELYAVVRVVENFCVYTCT